MNPLATRLKDLMVQVPIPPFSPSKPTYLNVINEEPELFQRKGIPESAGTPYLLSYGLAVWQHLEWGIRCYILEYLREHYIEIAFQYSRLNQLMAIIVDRLNTSRDVSIYPSFIAIPVSDEPNDTNVLLLVTQYFNNERYTFEILMLDDVTGEFMQAFNTPV